MKVGWCGLISQTYGTYFGNRKPLEKASLPMVGHVLLCVEPKLCVGSSNKVNTGTPQKGVIGLAGTSQMSTHTIIIQDKRLRNE